MPAGVTVRNLNIAVKVNATGALTKLNSIAKALKQLQSKIATTEALQQRLKKIEEDMSTVGTASSDAAKGVEEVAKATKKVSSSAPKVKKVSDSFSRMLKTLRSITIYRALTTALMAVINMMKEGYETFSKFIKLTNDKRLNNAVSGLTYEITKLKLALGSLGAESVDNAQAPLSGLSDTLYAIINAFTWLSASLNGADTYFTVNKKSVEEYSKELNEAKRSIMGFDEINKLSADSLVTDKLYDEKEVGFLGKFLEKFKVGFEQTLPGLWQFFSKIGKIKDFFSDETVSKIIEKVKSFGDALKESFGLAKEKIGEVIENIKTFMDKISSITTLLNPIVEALKIIYGWITKVFKDGLTEANEWAKEEIGKICDSFNGIWQGIKSAFEATKEWFKDKGIEIKLFFDNLPEKVKELYNDAKDWIEKQTLIFSTKVDGIVGKIKTSFSDASVWVETQKLTIKVGFTDFLDDLKAKLQSIVKWLKEAPLKILLKFGLLGKDNSDSDIDGLFSNYPGSATTGSIGSSSYGSGLKFEKVTLKANGGFPSVGSMFIAGEDGPEFVGSINGKTGVASGDEVTGIRTAVYSIGEAIVSAINNKDTNAVVRLDDGSIYKASQRGAKRVGNSLISFAN